MKKAIAFLVSMVLSAWVAASAGAHMFWLNPMNYTPAVGSTVEVGIGWGHAFPADRTDQEVKADRLEAIEAMDPDGKPVPLIKVATDRYRLNIEKAGAYIITARLKSGFFSMTPEGRKWGDKKEIANAVKCTNFHMEAKAVLLAGGVAHQQDRATDRPVELVALSDLRQTKAGGRFEACVFFEGKPSAGAQVKALYAGYEESKSDASTSAPSGHGIKHYPMEAQTGDQGRVAFSPERAGHWLIIVTQKAGFADKEVCDEHMYNVTYALEVK